jgi:pilus assembly protein CpaF
VAARLVGGLEPAVGLIDRVAAQIAAGTVPLRPVDVTAEARRLLQEAAPQRAHLDEQGVADHVLGLGPIETLLRQADVSDILVNGPNEIWVERAGVMTRVDASFQDSDSVLRAVERTIAPLGLRVDRSAPFVDARLPDGSRLHAVIPPAAVDHPIVAIRRFTRALTGVQDLVSTGTATQQQVDLLSGLVEKRKTILISGGTGTGKTTLLNLLACLLPESDRVVTIEEAAELEIPGHIVRLEARPPNAEGAGEITIRQLLRSALRLRPDRIILGEVRGAEALELVWALNTGHRGSLSTIHANSPAEALWRLETLALSGGNVGSESVQRQIESAVGAVVQLEREGSERRIREVVVFDD